MIKIPQFSFNCLNKLLKENSIKILSLNVYFQEVDIFITQKDLPIIGNLLNKHGLMPLIKNNLTMTIISVKNPKEKIEIIARVNQILDSHKFPLLQITDKKDKIYFIFENLSYSQQEKIFKLLP